ncbi:alpha/beta fold hydrolase [Roseateles sp. BYS180W]|uniref:Alpha/beta fold hydrolase n=1 Tax=Roseateles rivi TaxID=3299028 RepID=A0ABW7FYR3_9BURK
MNISTRTLARLTLSTALLALSSTGSWAQQQVQAGDITITVRGEGKPVLMIPGLNSAASTWEDTCTALQPGVQCHMAQLPGFAGAPASERYRAGVIASATADLNAYLKQRPMPVVGHSLGGVIALNMALQPQARVKRLVIVDSLPFFSAMQNPAMTPEQTRPMAEAQRSAMIAGGMSEEAQRAMLARMAATMAQDSQRQAAIVQWGMSSDRSTTAQAMFDMTQTDLRAAIAGIQVPTTVLGSWAAYKPFGSTKESTQAIFQTQFQALKPLELRMSESGYHFLMWDDAALVTAAIRNAL